MEFSEQYLTYEEYKALGGTLDLTPFNILEFEAKRKIDERTQGRLKKVEEIPQEVKLCMYNLITDLDKYAKEMTRSQSVASENIDGYSVSYVTGDSASNLVTLKNKELDDIIMTYLVGVVVNNEHILYLGV